jgi:hypothetical protein
VRGMFEVQRSLGVGETVGENEGESCCGWVFGFDWMGAFCLGAEHFSMRLTLVGPQLL